MSNIKQIRCDRCLQIGVIITSQSPGDGRPKYICASKCGYSWTQGKKVNQGYRRK